MSASMVFHSISIKDMIGSCRPGFNFWYRQHFSVWIFQDISTLTDFNWIVSMVKSDLMDTYTITDSSCGSKSKWALVHMCTCKAAANRSNVYVSGKKYLIKYFQLLRQCKVYQSVQSQSKKGANKQKKVTTQLKIWILEIIVKIFCNICLSYEKVCFNWVSICYKQDETPLK
jgi:hypothetical protein